jgi:HEAT repeat protein
MMAHQSWRVRAESINILGYLVKNSPITFLSEKVVKFVVDYLKDRANAVRKEGVKLIVRLIEQHGQPWVEKNIISKMLPMFKSPTFLHRETILLSLETLIPKLSQECLSKQIFSNVFYLVQDPVENVRMSVCVALSLLWIHLPKEKDAIRKLAKNLKDDKDNDVKEMAVKLLGKLD